MYGLETLDGAVTVGGDGADTTPSRWHHTKPRVNARWTPLTCTVSHIAINSTDSTGVVRAVAGRQHPPPKAPTNNRGFAPCYQL